MLPRLEKSACGCSLYTGSLILAWLGFLGTIFGLIALILTGIDAFTTESSLNGSPTEPPPTEDDKRAKDALVLAIKILFAVMLAVLIVAVLLNGCLIVGVYKRNHCLIMPYLIFGAMGICLNALGALIYLVLCFIYPATILDFIYKLIGTIISGYFWLIIYNFWREVKDEHESNSQKQQTVFNKL